MLSSSTSISKTAGLAAGTAFLVLILPYFISSPAILSLVGNLDIVHSPKSSINTTDLDSPPYDPSTFICTPHTFRTELISISPLVLYIHSFLTPAEITALLALGDPHFAPSKVSNSAAGI